MTTRKYNKSKQFRKSKKIQRGGELKLDELKELKEDFEKLGYEFEESREEGYKPFGYVRKKDTDKPPLDQNITELIESNLFKPHKIEEEKEKEGQAGSNDFIKKGNLLDFFKSGLKIDETLAKKLVENNYKKLFENKKGKITNPTKFKINDYEGYSHFLFKGYHMMERYGKSNPPQPQSTWQYIAGLYFTAVKNDGKKHEVEFWVDKNNFQNCPVIKTIEYFEIDKRIEERKAASDAFIAARSVNTNSPATQVLSNSNIMNEYVKGSLGGKKSRKTRKTRKTRKAKKAKKAKKTRKSRKA